MTVVSVASVAAIAAAPFTRLRGWQLAPATRVGSVGAHTSLGPQAERHRRAGRHPHELRCVELHGGCGPALHADPGDVAGGHGEHDRQRRHPPDRQRHLGDGAGRQRHHRCSLRIGDAGPGRFPHVADRRRPDDCCRHGERSLLQRLAEELLHRRGVAASEHGEHRRPHVAPGRRGNGVDPDGVVGAPVERGVDAQQPGVPARSARRRPADVGLAGVFGLPLDDPQRCALERGLARTELEAVPHLVGDRAHRRCGIAAEQTAGQRDPTGGHPIADADRGGDGVTSGAAVGDEPGPDRQAQRGAGARLEVGDDGGDRVGQFVGGRLDGRALGRRDLTSTALTRLDRDLVGELVLGGSERSVDRSGDVGGDVGSGQSTGGGSREVRWQVAVEFEFGGAGQRCDRRREDRDRRLDRKDTLVVDEFADPHQHRVDLRLTVGRGGRAGGRVDRCRRRRGVGGRRRC